MIIGLEEAGSDLRDHCRAGISATF